MKETQRNMGGALPELAEKTDFPEVDRLLTGLVGIIEGCFPDRVTASYIFGSYAFGKVTPSSDLDLFVVFKDRISQEERERFQHLRRCCARLTHMNLDVKSADEYSLQRYGLPVLSCNTRFLHGEDLRDRIPENPVDFRNWALHVPYGPNGLLAHLRREQPAWIYPLGPIAPKDRFLGYDVRPIRNEDGSMDKSVKMLPSAVMQLGMGLIGAKTGICPNNKAVFPVQYRTHIGDEWSDYLDGVYEFCVLRCQGRLPEDEAMRDEFVALCRDALEFENHYLRRYREWLLAELTAPRRQEETDMKIRPLQDRILVKRVDEEETTSGGIIIPDSAKEKPQEGLVVAVGPGKTLDNGSLSEPAVNKGDRILFSKYAGTEVNLEGEEHIIIREDDILAIYE